MSYNHKPYDHYIGLASRADEQTYGATEACRTEVWSGKADAKGLRAGVDPPISGILPGLSLASDKNKIHDVTIHGREGRSDTISAISTHANEGLAQLLKQLHPNLSAEQLVREVAHTLKYNKDYGNDLGDGSRLSDSKQVYLPSVKYTDNLGRIRRIEGPTGRVTELIYDAAGCAGYRITEADGSISEEAHKLANGRWSATRLGHTGELKDVRVDCWGDITATGDDGSQVGHLTCGDDIYTKCDGNRPLESICARAGEPITRYVYEYEGDNARVYAIYTDNPSARVLLTNKDAPEALMKTITARGLTPQYDWQPGMAMITSGDLSPDSEVASRLVQAGFNLIGTSVKSVDPSVPETKGCATIVRKMVEMATGIHMRSNSCNGLEKELKRYFEPVRDLKPGDIIIFKNAEGHDKHTVLYVGDGKTGDGKTVGNSTSLRRVAETSLSAFHSFPRSIVYRYVGPHKSAG